MNLSNKKIFVTGADGFIGSHLVERLVQQGHDVRALVQYNSFNSWGWLDTVSDTTKKNIEVISGDVRDPNGVKVAMQGCHVVMHLAALIAIPYSYHFPDSYVETNVKGTLNIVQAARDLGIEKVIHTSTSEVYGTAQFVPITENHPLHAQSPYAASKIGADQMAMSYYLSFGTPVCIIRPFNTYGPRQSARAIIPTVITQMANHQKSIRLGSLHPTRDLNFVTDTVNAYIAMAASDDVIGETVNAGSNYEVSVGDTVKLIASIMDREVEIIADEKRMRPEKSEVNRLWACNAKIKAMTAWTPEYSGLEGLKRGLMETIAWFSQADNLRFYKSDVYNL